MFRKDAMKTPATRLLDSKKRNYRPLYYSVEDGHVDGLSVASKLQIPPNLLYKTLVLESKSFKNYVFLVPSDKELNLKQAAKFLKEKSLDLLPLSRLKSLTGYEKGGCSPLAMKKNLPTFIYKEAKNQKLIYVSGGKLGLSLEIPPKLLEEFLDLTYLDI